MRSEKESKCKCWGCCSHFQEIVKLSDTGLNIYSFFPNVKEVNLRSKNLDEIFNSVIFLYHNTTKFVISTKESISVIGQYVKCPRCKYLLEHANKLLKTVSKINAFETISRCGHCNFNNMYKIPCKHCYGATKQFIGYKNQKIKEIDEFIQWMMNLKMKIPHSWSNPELTTLNKQHNFNKSSRLLNEPPTTHLCDVRTVSTNQVNDQQHYEYLLKCSQTHHMLFNNNLKTKDKDGRIQEYDNELKFIEYFNENLKSIVPSDIDFNEQKQTKLKYIHMYQDDINVVRQDLIQSETNLTSPNFYSDKSFLDFDETAAQETLQKTFSFVFIKTRKKLPNSLRIYKSSSELINDTRKMIHEKEDQKKQSKERKNNFIKKDTKLTEKKIEYKPQVDETNVNKDVQEEEKIPPSNEANHISAEKPESRKLKKKVSKLSNSHSKPEKNIEIKPEPKEKYDNKNSIYLESETKKAKTEKQNEDRLKRGKDQTYKEKEPKQETEQREKNKKQLMNRKDDLTKEETKKGDNMDEFKKLLGEQKKQKEEKSRKILDVAQKDAKQQFPLETKNKGTISDATTEVQDKKKNELKVNQNLICKASADDLILQLVKLKQTYSQKERQRPKRLSEINIDPLVISAHKSHQNRKEPSCAICNDSELELDIENIVNNQPEKKDAAEIITGQKILKYRARLEEKKQNSRTPLLFTSKLEDDDVNIPKHDVYSTTSEGDLERKDVSAKTADQEVPKGIIRYALSDRTFIDKGWTMLPTEKVVRKMNVYRMRPAHPEFDWFEHNKNKKLMHYDTGEKLAEFDDNGRGRWFYKNGKIALDYYDAKEINAQQRFVIYSNGEPDERGRFRPLAILATFDYLGNGIVFDHTGKIRLKYNQTEGIILDRSIGPVSHWKWHTLNDPPVLQQVMIDTQMAHKDPEILKLGGPADDKVRLDNEEMLAIEFDNFIKEKSKKLSQKFKPFQIKMKALKINENFSLKVLDQATVYLIFRDGSTNLKINIGMILDHKEIIDTDIAEVGEVSNSLERFPARTDSLAGLQKSVAYAQRVERAQLERERRLRPTEPCQDKVNSVVSRPLRTPLHKVSSCDTVTSTGYMCRCRKSSCNLYYDTRLT